MKKKIALADSEWRLMQIIWEKSPCTFRDICDAACEPNGWTKHDVMSYLKRMEAKGAIAVKDAKPVKLYTAILNKEETIEEETEDLLNRVYNGSLLLMVQSAVRGRGMSEEDMESLKALLAKGERYDG